MRTEDEMVRGAFIQRAPGDRMTVAVAMKRYLADVVPTKRPTTQVADRKRPRIIVKHLGRYSLTSLTPEIIAQFRDMRLAGKIVRMRTETRSQIQQYRSSGSGASWSHVDYCDQRVGRQLASPIRSQISGVLHLGLDEIVDYRRMRNLAC